jgi:hypothetical protein
LLYCLPSTSEGTGPNDIGEAQQVESSKDNGQRRRRTRSIAIALLLAGLVVLFYVATIVRLGGDVLMRPL